MRCEEARDIILEGQTAALKGDRRLGFESHLSDCPACRTDRESMERLAEAARAWRDEPVPSWNRGSCGGLTRVKPVWWATWVPLAACIALAVLVLSRTELTVGASGVSLHFGGAESRASAEADPEAIKAYVDQALIRSQNLTATQIQDALQRFRQDQELYFQELTLNLTDYHKQRRSEDFKQLLTQWQGQRQEDLALVEQQINTLFARQNRYGNTLYSLANYVTNVPRGQRPEKEKL